MHLGHRDESLLPRRMINATTGPPLGNLEVHHGTCADAESVGVHVLESSAECSRGSRWPVLGEKTQFTYFLSGGMIACRLMRHLCEDASDRLHTKAVISSKMPFLASPWWRALYVHANGDGAGRYHVKTLEVKS